MQRWWQHKVSAISSTLLLKNIATGIKCVDPLYTSQAARQGLALLMASAGVVLKYETSTIRQSHNFIPMNSTFDVGDKIREVTSPATFGSNPMDGRDATWGQHYTGTLTFLYSSTQLQPILVHQFSRTIAQKTRFGVRKILLGMRIV